MSVLYLDVLPVQEVAQLQSSAQDHGGHISDDLHQSHAAVIIYIYMQAYVVQQGAGANLCPLLLCVGRVPLRQSNFALPTQ